MDRTQCLEIANIIFDNLTDPLLIYDFAKFFYTNDIPKSFYCVLDDNDKSRSEILSLKEKFPEHKIDSENMNFVSEIKIKDFWVTFEITDRCTKSYNIIEKTSSEFRKLCKNYICPFRGCKNKCLGKKKFCGLHV